MMRMLARLGAVLRRYSLLLVLVVEVAVFAGVSPAFLTFQNAEFLLRQVTAMGIIAAGTTLLLILGHVDLSVGSLVALSGAVAAGVTRDTGSFALGAALALVVGVLAGLGNGFIVVRMKVNAFIATLSTMFVLRGVVMAYTREIPIFIESDSFKWLANGYLGRIPSGGILLFLASAASYIILHKTKLGHHLFAVGGNREASRIVGINAMRLEIIVFVYSAVLTALGGLAYAARWNTASAAAGVGLDLQVIAAMVLGGTKLTGGQGGIAHTILGVLALGILYNGLSLVNIHPYQQQALTGLLVVLVVAFGLASSRLRTGRIVGQRQAEPAL